MAEAHCTPYSVHPGGDKIYKDLKKTFWWPNMKRDVAKFMARCLTCQRVKGEQQRPHAQDRQKSYADFHRRDIEFTVGDKVLLKVSPMRGVTRFGKKDKLSQKFIGLYEILDRIGEVAYMLALPPALDRVHNVFHISQLRKYVSDPSHVLEIENIELDESLSYAEVPKEILDRKVRKTRNGETVLLKVL
ncbi:uncharacterized protein LOC141588600 [Silene latifolia]|uniref:uncharacterized protein LOC141588600 n=1 Tax=Silene latifolia TaxID=37657 RepID=UPI003D7845B5